VTPGARFVALYGGVFMVAACTEAFERGAGRRFPAWDRFVVQLVVAVGVVLAGVYAITLAFLLWGRWG